MLFAKKKMRYVTLSDSELRLAKYALLRFRNTLIAKGLPTEDVNALLLKLYKQKHSMVFPAMAMSGEPLGTTKGSCPAATSTTPSPFPARAEPFMSSSLPLTL